VAITGLWLVRHGESVANVAADAAERAGAEVIAVEFRDADVPLSRIGLEQAAALGRWLATVPKAESPAAVWVSPYLRARQTAEIALATAERSIPARVDERLRDRELGVLDLHTSLGVDVRFAAEAARRRWLGKFYYRPPGGESWADVALRVRSVLHEMDATIDGQSVLVVAHDALVMLFLYVCLELDERRLLDFAVDHTVPNASVTRFTRSGPGGGWQLDAFARDDHLVAQAVPVTEHPGDKDVDIH
jgi:broad specificity phosphatase PhoE